MDRYIASPTDTQRMADRQEVYKDADICSRCGGIISQSYLKTMGCGCKLPAQPAPEAPEQRPGCSMDLGNECLRGTDCRCEKYAVATSENQRLRSALTEARRFMDYFANDRREFVGPGTLLSCLAHIDWALNPNAAPEAPESRSRDGARGGTEEQRCEIVSANDNESDLQAVFDLRWKADMRAIARWRAATGKNLTLPDHTDLCVWLLNKLMDASEIMRPFANFAPKAEGFVENAAATPGASSIMPTREFRLSHFKRAKEFFDTWNSDRTDSATNGEHG